jgi:hypothetical protein
VQYENRLYDLLPEVFGCRFLIGAPFELTSLASPKYLPILLAKKIALISNLFSLQCWGRSPSLTCLLAKTVRKVALPCPGCVPTLAAVYAFSPCKAHCDIGGRGLRVKDIDAFSTFIFLLLLTIRAELRLLEAPRCDKIWAPITAARHYGNAE